MHVGVMPRQIAAHASRAKHAHKHRPHRRVRKIFAPPERSLARAAAPANYTIPFRKMLGWWNWQTRTFEGRMAQAVRVQVPPRVLWQRWMCGVCQRGIRLCGDSRTGWRRLETAD